MNYYPLCKNETLFVLVKLNVAVNLPNILYIFVFIFRCQVGRDVVIKSKYWKEILVVIWQVILIQFNIALRLILLYVHSCKIKKGASSAYRCVPSEKASVMISQMH
jgi:hypothetical protein